MIRWHKKSNINTTPYYFIPYSFLFIFFYFPLLCTLFLSFLVHCKSVCVIQPPLSLPPWHICFQLATTYASLSVMPSLFSAHLHHSTTVQTCWLFGFEEIWPEIATSAHKEERDENGRRGWRNGGRNFGVSDLKKRLRRHRREEEEQVVCVVSSNSE